MSRVAPPSGEEVETDQRRAMTPARKRRIWEAWERKCWFCRMPVPMDGPEVIYDHVGTLWITGSDADKDIGPIHANPCNKAKTAADHKRIAKTKRQTKACLPREPEDREPGSIRSRGFEKPQTKKPWPSRPFPRRKTE